MQRMAPKTKREQQNSVPDYVCLAVDERDRASVLYSRHLYKCSEEGILVKKERYSELSF